MYVGNDFSDVNPSETVPLTFDFVNDIKTVGVTVASAVWSVSVSTGYDPSPSSRLISTPANSGTQTSQFFGNALAGVKYLVAAVATMSDGSIMELFSHVSCKAPV